MMTGMSARAAENEREERVVARLLADVEEREKRLAGRLLVLDGIEMELAQKGQWEIKQWTDLAALLERRRVEIKEIREEVAGLAPTATAPITKRKSAPVPKVPAAPQPMEGVRATLGQEVRTADEDCMEGVKREGLFASLHVPAPEESAPAAQEATVEEGKKKKKEKGKAKEVHVATLPAKGHAERQQLRQAAVDAASANEKRDLTHPIRPILKCPETAEAEQRQEERRRVEVAKKEEDKGVARKRWEEWGKMTEAEQNTYTKAANQIKATAYEDTVTAEEQRATWRVAHKAGIQEVEVRWERMYDEARGQPQTPCRPQHWQQPDPQQQQGRQQQAQPTVPPKRQQQDNWAQRVAAAAALPQEDYRRVGRNDKAAHEPSRLEPIKDSIPCNERGIVLSEQQAHCRSTL